MFCVTVCSGAYLGIMQTTIGKIRGLVRKTLILTEMRGPTGNLRRVRSGGQRHKIGKIEDENREVSFAEAEMLFPGSTNAWAEIVPELFPQFPFDDPFSIKRNSVFFKEGDGLTVAFADHPQFNLATWDPTREDWIENELAGTG